VRKLDHSFRTSIFLFYVLTKGEAAHFLSSAVYVVDGPKLHAASYKIFMTDVKHTVQMFITGYNCAVLVSNSMNTRDL
jgi:hypothetical protein